MAALPPPKPNVSLQFSLNPDGSLTSLDFPTSPPSPTFVPNNATPVLSKDITFDPSNDDSWFRIYLPRQQQLDSAKLPVVFYFHGGGFLYCSPDVSIIHDFCSDMAESIPAVVVSFKYPLAPAHRLPAAYDHLLRATHWIKTNWADIDWLRDNADFSNCFFMGNSAGGNLAYHVGLRATAVAADLDPIEIRGVILHDPFFGGTERTPTELRLVNDTVLPLSACDLAWELSLPVGAGRDHEYSNVAGSDVEKMRALGWKVLVTGFEGDTLYDHQTAVAKMLENKGVRVETMFKEGGYHAMEVIDRSTAMPLHIVIKKFITGN